MEPYRHTLTAAVLLTFALIIIAIPCLADERILSFHSDIAVRADSTMTVTETVRVRCEGHEIKRGIYRDFPTDYSDRYGNRYRVGFHVMNVLRNDRPEPYHTQSLSNGVRVYIGRKDVFLRPGEYTYTLSYATDRQLGYFKDHDELYWNVTGNGWGFPIDNASATVRLPEGIPAERVKLGGYTGPQGSIAKNFIASMDASGTVNFDTVSPLGPGEGLSIVIGWPKGFIRPPTRQDRVGYFIRDNRAPIAGLASMIVILCYYLAVWARAGRDPAKGTIIPLYGPPKEISPAAMHFIYRMGYDQKTFAAAVINMAVKGYLTICEKKGTYTLAAAQWDDSALAPEEKKVAAILFGGARSIELNNKNHIKVSAAISMLKEMLKKQCEKIYFITNTSYFVKGTILSVILVLVSVLFSGRPEMIFISLFMSVWLTGWTFGLVFLLAATMSAWRTVCAASGARISSLGGAIVLSVIAVPFLGGEILGLWFLSQLSAPLMVAVLSGIVAINVVFYYLLKAPTLLGRRILDQIEGFKMFLSVAEKDRLNLLNPPDRTPELFERYLPYALALGVEQAWAQQFADVLARAAVDGTTYSPAWYSGSGWSTARVGAFSSSLGSSLSSSISSSSTAPGSSSGFGGGGGSGGGGGGGGGGGW